MVVEEEFAASDIKIASRALMVTDSSNPGNIQDFYATVGELGEGSYGAVHLATSRSTGEPRAVKTISKAKPQTVERGIKKIKYEIEVMLTLDHPNIVRLFETFEDRWNVFLVLELCRGESLEAALTRRGGFLAETEAALLMRQILEAVRYLHEQLVCHRDLKPENILFFEEFQEPISEQRLKVADFGLACRLPEKAEPMREKVGSLLYLAPQVLEGRYTAACDLWSCGAILYVMLAGRPPFHADSVAELQKIVRQGAVDLEGEVWDSITEAAKSVVRGLMQRPEERRLRAGQVLCHPWIQAAQHPPEDEADDAITPVAGCWCCASVLCPST